MWQNQLCSTASSPPWTEHLRRPHSCTNCGHPLSMFDEESEFCSMCQPFSAVSNQNLFPDPLLKLVLEHEGMNDAIPTLERQPWSDVGGNGSSPVGESSKVRDLYCSLWIDGIILALDYAPEEGFSREDICDWFKQNQPYFALHPSFESSVTSTLRQNVGKTIRLQKKGEGERFLLIRYPHVLKRLEVLKATWTEPQQLFEYGPGPEDLVSLPLRGKGVMSAKLNNELIINPPDLHPKFSESPPCEAHTLGQETESELISPEGTIRQVEDLKASTHQHPAFESTVGESSSYLRRNNFDSSVDCSCLKRQSTAPSSQVPLEKKLRLLPVAASTVVGPTFPVQNQQRERQEATLQVAQDNWSIQSSLVDLTPDQRQQITTVFAEALVKAIQGRYPLLTDNASSIPLQQRCQPLLKEFSAKTKNSAVDKQMQRSSRAIRSLRAEISQKCESLLLGEEIEDPSCNRTRPCIVEDAKRILPQQHSIEQKVNEWTQQTQQFLVQVNQYLAQRTLEETASPVSHQDRSVSPNGVPFRASSSARSDSARGSPSCASSSAFPLSEGGDIRDAVPAGMERAIFDYLTGHEAFTALVSEFERTVERYYVNTMQWIQKRILLALKRRQKVESPDTCDWQVLFSYDLDVVSFLQDQYGTSDIDLGRVLTVTGRPKNAQLLPISEYMLQTWEKSPLALLEAFRRLLTHEALTDGCDTSTGKIEICLENRTVLVSGPESLVVTVGQQLAWICAACQKAQDNQSTAHITFDEIHRSEDEASLSKIPKFAIKTEIKEVDQNEVKACWCDFLPNSVIAAGFPIHTRSSPNETGLEVPIEIMAALGGVMNVAEFDGGYVLKGRNIAFLPIHRQGDSVQWHFIKGEGARLRYQELRTINRLPSTSFHEKDLYTTRAFLGWCSSVVNNYGTKMIGYQAILPPSNLEGLPKILAGLTTASVGFSKVAGDMIHFSISRRRDGCYHAQTPHFYQDLLKHARQLPIILQDMDHGRAFYLDGERFILGAVEHRHLHQPHRKDCKASSLHSAINNDTNSVLTSMLKNCDIILSHDQHIEDDHVHEKLYRHEVRDLYECLELLQAESENVTEAGMGLEMNWDQCIQGWSYTDFIDGKRRMLAQQATLSKTCGLWPALARDIGAIVLFGGNFGDIVNPLSNIEMCKAYKQVPRDYDFLAIEVKYIKAMLHQNRTIPDRGILTRNGLQLLFRKDLFGTCRVCKIQTGEWPNCNCKRIAQLSQLSNIPRPIDMQSLEAFAGGGGMLIGLGSAHDPASPRPRRNFPGSLTSTKPAEHDNSSTVSSEHSRPRGTRSIMKSLESTLSYPPRPRGTRPPIPSIVLGDSNANAPPQSQNLRSSISHIDDSDGDSDRDTVKGHFTQGPRAPHTTMPNLAPVDSETSPSSFSGSSLGKSWKSDANTGITTAPGTEGRDDNIPYLWKGKRDFTSSQCPVEGTDANNFAVYESHTTDEMALEPLKPHNEGQICQQTSCQATDFSQVQRTLRRKRPIDFDSSTRSETKRHFLSVDRF